MKLNTISPTLSLLKLGIRANQRSRRLYGVRLWVFWGFKYGSFVLWWGFVAYLIFKWFNG